MQHHVQWADTMQAITTELTATYDEGTYVVYVLHYGDHYVAFGRHHGDLFYIDVHGSKQLHQPGLFLVHFNEIQDLVNHGIKANAKERAAYCRCGHDGCTKCAFGLHTCKFRTHVSVVDVGHTILRDVTAQQLWAAVKEMYPLRPPKHIVKNLDDVDALLSTLHVGAIDSNWVDIVNERNATAAQAAKRDDYNCVCGHPLRVQAVPGNGWYKAHCEQSTAHKGYICSGHKWVNNRGRKKASTTPRAGATNATSIKVFCSPPKKPFSDVDCGLQLPSHALPQSSSENITGIPCRVHVVHLSRKLFALLCLARVYASACGANRGKAGQGTSGQGSSRHSRGVQGRARQGKAGQGSAGPGIRGNCRLGRGCCVSPFLSSFARHNVVHQKSDLVQPAAEPSSCRRM